VKTSYMWIDPRLPNDHRITGLSMPLASALEAMASLGFDGVELMIGDPEAFDADAFASAVKGSGLEVSQICTGELSGSYGLALNHPDLARRKAAVRAAEKCIRLAGRWRCSVGIGRFRGKIWDAEPRASVERMTDSMRFLDRIAGDEGVKVLLEPLRPDICDTLNSVSATTAFIDAAGLESFGWLLDTDHVELGEASGLRGETESPDFVHLADSMHAPLGRGKIDFRAYLSLIASMEYQGYCSIEVFSDETVNERQFLSEMAGVLSKFFREAEIKGKIRKAVNYAS